MGLSPQQEHRRKERQKRSRQQTKLIQVLQQSQWDRGLSLHLENAQVFSSVGWQACASSLNGEAIMAWLADHPPKYRSHMDLAILPSVTAVMFWQDNLAIAKSWVKILADYSLDVGFGRSQLYALEPVMDLTLRAPHPSLHTHACQAWNFSLRDPVLRLLRNADPQALLKFHHLMDFGHQGDKDEPQRALRALIEHQKEYDPHTLLALSKVLENWGADLDKPLQGDFMGVPDDAQKNDTFRDRLRHTERLFALEDIQTTSRQKENRRLRG